MLARGPFLLQGSARLERQARQSVRPSSPPSSPGSRQLPSALPMGTGPHQLRGLTLQAEQALCQAWAEQILQNCHLGASLGLKQTPVPGALLPANLGIREHLGFQGQSNSWE